MTTVVKLVSKKTGKTLAINSSDKPLRSLLTKTTHLVSCDEKDLSPDEQHMLETQRALEANEAKYLRY